MSTLEITSQLFHYFPFSSLLNPVQKFPDFVESINPDVSLAREDKADVYRNEESLDDRNRFSQPPQSPWQSSILTGAILGGSAYSGYEFFNFVDSQSVPLFSLPGTTFTLGASDVGMALVSAATFIFLKPGLSGFINQYISEPFWDQRVKPLVASAVRWARKKPLIGSLAASRFFSAFSGANGFPTLSVREFLNESRYHINRLRLDEALFKKNESLSDEESKMWAVIEKESRQAIQSFEEALEDHQDFKGLLGPGSVLCASLGYMTGYSRQMPIEELQAIGLSAFLFLGVLPLASRIMWDFTTGPVYTDMVKPRLAGVIHKYFGKDDLLAARPFVAGSFFRFVDAEFKTHTADLLASIARAKEFISYLKKHEQESQAKSMLLMRYEKDLRAAELVVKKYFNTRGLK